MLRDPQHPACGRRAARVRTCGRALVHGDHGVTQGDVIDLSLGGVRVRSDALGGEMPSVGDPVSVELHLTTSVARWHDLSAHVVRIDGDRLVLAFDRVPLELEDEIEEEILAAWEAARVPRVVVVDPCCVRRAHLTATVRRAACEPIEAATPLEAIERIEESRTHAAAVVVGERLTQTEGGELVRYVQESHPDMRVAVIRDAEHAADAPVADGVVVLDADECEQTGWLRSLLGGVAPVV